MEMRSGCIWSSDMGDGTQAGCPRTAVTLKTDGGARRKLRGSQRPGLSHARVQAAWGWQCGEVIQLCWRTEPAAGKPQEGQRWAPTRTARPALGEPTVKTSEGRRHLRRCYRLPSCTQAPADTGGSPAAHTPLQSQEGPQLHTRPCRHRRVPRCAHAPGDTGEFQVHTHTQLRVPQEYPRGLCRPRQF